jgi:hypothetical protein
LSVHFQTDERAAQCSDPETAELGSSGHFGLFATTGGVHAITAD